jgi:hypothetical protein
MDPIILERRKAVIAARAVIFVNFWIELCHAHHQAMLSKGASYDPADYPTTSSFNTLFRHSPPEVLVKVITDSFTDEASYLLGLSSEELEHFDPASLRQLPESQSKIRIGVSTSISSKTPATVSCPHTSDQPREPPGLEPVSCVSVA